MTDFARSPNPNPPFDTTVEGRLALAAREPTQSATLSIREPANDADWAAYYSLRHQILRAPWGQPPGSERDEHEAQAYHLLAAVGAPPMIVGVARMHPLDAVTGQVRYMAVAERVRGQGVGRQLLQGLEVEARRRGLLTLVLNARDTALPFYLSCGYRIVGDAPPLFGIAHQRMRKDLAEPAAS